MVNFSLKKYFCLSIIILFSFSFSLNANASDYPNTSIGLIDINLILNESKVAKDADEQIQEIAAEIEEKIRNDEENLIKEQQKLIEAQNVMAPEAFEEKRLEYEKKVQEFQIKNGEIAAKLDTLINTTRARILDEIEPILEEIADEKGITIIMEKTTVILNADNMDITKIVLKKLNKKLSKLKVELN